MVKTNKKNLEGQLGQDEPESMSIQDKAFPHLACHRLDRVCEAE